MSGIALKRKLAVLANYTSILNGMKATVDGFDIENVTSHKVNTQIRLAESSFEKYTALQESVLEASSEDQIEHYTAMDLEVVRSYHEMISHLEELKGQLKDKSDKDKADSGVSSRSYTSTARLKKLELDKFSGKVTDWRSFYDSFMSLVHNNADLTEVEKFRYLKDALDFEPKSLIASLEVTNANYKPALTMLIERYENKRLIVYEHLKALFNLPFSGKDSGKGLRALLDTVSRETLALNAIGYNFSEDTADLMLTFMVMQRMDDDTYKQFNQSSNTNPSEIPKWEDLRKFMNNRCHEIESRNINVPKPPTHMPQQQNQRPIPNNRPNQNNNQGFNANGNNGFKPKSKQCVLCPQETHLLFHCPIFKSKSVQERFNITRDKKLCKNCLFAGHVPKDCQSKFKCLKCKQPHNTLLHIEPEAALTATVEHSTVVLPSAIVQVKDSTGKYVHVRALLDQGSQACIITEECTKRLGLTREKADRIACGLGGKLELNKGEVKLSIRSLINDFELECRPLVVGKVTGLQPSRPVISEKLKCFQNLPLADPNYATPGKIDLLIGGGEVAQVQLEQIVRSGYGGPIAQKTQFGYVVSGATKVNTSTTVGVYHVQTFRDAEYEIRRFLQIEEIPEEKRVHFTKEELECEEQFASTHKRDDSGRFIVRLPVRENACELGGSKEIARRRLFATERRLEKVPAKKPEYVKFLEEYERMGHMTKVPWNPNSSFIYLPHHFVEKAESTTTKLRVVFDASCKTGNGNSLNDILKVGPKLQDDLVCILLRFRFHEIAITGDLAKMFRQILVHTEDRKWQHILWRNQENGQISDYELNTVTYGTASASYLATKCMQQLAHDENNTYPLASTSVLHDLLMDDYVGGTSGLDTAKELVKQLIQMFKKGCFDLRKIMSNSKELMDLVPVDLRGIQSDDLFGTDEKYKMLGVSWDFAKDMFCFKLPDFPTRKIVTKRTVASDVARVFDPLGWLGPIVIKAKILLQKIWSLKIGWDEKIPPEMLEEWNEFMADIFKIPRISLPRCVIQPNYTELEIHGFSDASQKALALCIYVVTVGPTGIRSSTLLIGKTKVAPLKTVTIPRLELAAAADLAKLLVMVRDSLKSLGKLTFKTLAWTDSMITLDWIKSEPGKWETFVGNRVAQIQRAIPGVPWGHVISEENPADIGSRGMSVDELVHSKLWWEGPKWLLTTGVPLGHEEPEIDKETIDKEKRKFHLAPMSNTCLLTSVSEQVINISKFSNLHKLLSITGYVLRFIGKSKNYNSKVLSVEERNMALIFWIKIEQENYFSWEKNLISKGKTITSLLKNYYPFLDQDGLMRVGGRLNNAEHLPINTKNPIVLHKDSHLTKLLVRDVHWKNLHAGATLMISTIRQNYFVINLRDLVKKCTRSCIICTRYRAKTIQPTMADLPKERVTPNPVFYHTGTDYAGPIMVRTWKGRGFKSVKSYVCIFVCYSTKAVHLEAVTDLTSEAFIAALQRFVSLRGKPAFMHSDHGTNYVGAARDIQQFYLDSQVEEYASREGISWSFTPPKGPHFGGIWEAVVKSTKLHLKKYMGSYSLTYEELATSLSKISACLNSRPLHPMNDDPSSLSVLTPGHFLVGRPLNSLPMPDVRHLKWNTLDRWQRVEQITQQFWDQWSRDYLVELQRRNKWLKPDVEIQLGDIVIIMDDLTGPGEWKLGRVINIFKGHDGVARTVKLKTATTELVRPLVKVILLPTQSSG